MTDPLRSALGRQVSAVERADFAALVEASLDYIATVDADLGSGTFGGLPVMPRYIASCLISEPDSRKRADAFLRRMVRMPADAKPYRLAKTAEADWEIWSLPDLQGLRFLRREWRPLPGMPGRDDLAALPAGERRELRAGHKVLEGMRTRDGKMLASGIAALAKEDEAWFSMMAYALYREARAAGIKVKVPVKYDF